ncbi:unnamed protein product, partial [Didymodactylos carnosus]
SKLSKDETNTYKLVIYRPVEPLLQVGPQCGIVALAMASELGGFSYTVQNIFEKAKELKCTIQGELFDAHMIPVLCKKFNIEAKVHRWTKLEDLTDYLQSNHVCLMPYDADANHEPCKRLGHRAHWALIHGYVKLFPVREENHSDLVLVHHGKSRHVAAWSIRDLYESNLQLNEFKWAIYCYLTLFFHVNLVAC